jgi:hypothetical protein
MAFIPSTQQIGDKVRLTKNVKVMAGTYTVGHEFTITGKGDRGYDLIDDHGRNLSEVHCALHGGKYPFVLV